MNQIVDKISTLQLIILALTISTIGIFLAVPEIQATCASSLEGLTELVRAIK
jgi:hypothetical protein